MYHQKKVQMNNKLLKSLQHRITFIYLIAGLLWILFSDRFLLLFTSNLSFLTQLQTYKGWFFIAMTSLMLFVLLRNYSKRINHIMNDLNKAKQKSEESDRLKSAFLANISHEVRTPLNAILGFSELLRDTNYNEPKRITYLSHIVQNGENLLMLMNNIIDVSIIESGQARFEAESIKINTLLKEIQNNNTSLINAANDIQFSILNNVAENNDSNNVFQDKKKLLKIINQLIDNAFKFTKQGSISISIDTKDNILIFNVSDTGIGIPYDQTSAIFQKFWQLEEGYKRFYGGSGIGLYIANEYTKIIGGTLKVNSSLGKGSTFTLLVPLSANQNTPKLPIISQNNTDWASKTILVVEDISSNFDVIDAMLKPTKAKLLWTKDGLEAIQTFKAIPNIDLALVDINLPLLSGIEVCKAIKKSHPSFPVILQTAYSFNFQANDFKESGCNLVIEKPINRKDLIEAIGNLLVT
jgi:signal transduction histidine kinase/CheY-like chemotaxis protein